MLRTIAALTLLLFSLAAWADLPRHRIEVDLDPATGSLQARDTITLPEAWPGGRELAFTLHRGLAPQVITPEGARIEPAGDPPGPQEGYCLHLPPGAREATVSYGGRIRHELQGLGDPIGGREVTYGTISEEGVYLDGASGWYPQLQDFPMLRFELAVSLPEGWRAVSQGARPLSLGDGESRRQRWVEELPQDEIYLVAGRYHEYTGATGPVALRVFLREEAPALAERYLEAAGGYIDLYSRLIGDYPYAKMAVVENFWETGYGMPSFTLLGPRVIRLPFIVHTSFPHEILHNWWGNGVYVDYRLGNWSEGLTAYLADHLLKARRGEGEAYRRDLLLKYTAYVREHREQPLSAFVARHGEASQAIGYGKGAMLYHMLRRRVGEEAFVEGLRRFWRENRFSRAGYTELQAAFEAASGERLDAFFGQWLNRTGAPLLELAEVGRERADAGWRLRATLRQAQEAEPFELEVPYAVLLASGEVREGTLRSAAREAALELELPAEPLRLAVDPRFDVFRRLHGAELPATLAGLFAERGGLMVLPSTAPAGLGEGYRRLAEAWGLHTVSDAHLERLPSDRPVWVAGWENRFRTQLAERLPAGHATLRAEGAAVAGERYAAEGHCVVLTAPSGEAPRVWLGCGDPAALPGLARKLPHYSKYSYLAFAGSEPTNVLKGQWPVVDSPLSRRLAEGEVPPLDLSPRPPLTAVLATD